METPAEIAAKELEERQAELEAARSATVARQTGKGALAKVQGKETIDLAGGSVTRISPNTTMIDYSASFRNDTGALVTDKAYISSDIPAGGVTMRLGQDDRVVFDTAAIGENRTIRLDQRGNGKLAFAIPEGSDFNVQYDEKTRTATMVIERDGKQQTIKVEGVSNLDELEVGTLDRANNRISSFATVGQVQAQQKADDKVADQSKEDAIAAAQAKVDAALITVDEIEASRPAVPEPVPVVPDPVPAPREVEPTNIDDAIDRNIAAQEAIRAFRGAEPMTADEKAEEKKNLKEGGSTVAEFNESSRELEGQLKAMQGYKAAFEAKATAEGKDPKAEWEAQMAQTGDIMGRGASEVVRVTNTSLTAEQINARTEDLKNPEAKNKAMDSYAQSINDYRKAVGLREVPVDGLRASVAGGSSGEITETAKAWSDAAKEAAKYKEKFFQVAQAQGKDPQKEWDAQSKIPNSEVQQVINGLNAETLAARTAALPTVEVAAEQTRNAAIDRNIASVNAFETAAGIPVTDPAKIRAETNPSLTTEQINGFAQQWDSMTKELATYKDKFLKVEMAKGKDAAQAQAEWDNQAKDPNSTVYKITHKQMNAEGIAAVTNALPNPEVVAVRTELETERTARAELELRGKYEGKMGSYIDAQANYAKQVLGKNDAEAKQFGLEAGRGLEGQMNGNPSGTDQAWRKAHTEAMTNDVNTKTTSAVALKTQLERLYDLKGTPPAERAADLKRNMDAIEANSPQWSKDHLANISNQAQKLTDLKAQFDNLHNIRGTPQAERDAEWKGAVGRAEKEGVAFMDTHNGNLRKLAAASQRLKPAVEENLRASGVPENQIVGRTLQALKAMDNAVLENWNNNEGVGGWPQRHADNLRKEAQSYRDLDAQIDRYAQNTGMSPADVARHKAKYSTTEFSGLDGNSTAAKDAERAGQTALWREGAFLANQYWKSFKYTAEQAGLDPTAEWERRKAIPGSDVNRIASGDLQNSELRGLVIKMVAQPAAAFATEASNARIADLERRLAERPVTPAGPAVAGSAVVIDNEGKFVGMATLTRDGDKTIAKDAEGRALAAGTVITATVDNGSGARTNERFTVREGGEIQAPTGASVGGLPPAGRGV